jgi:catechol 2,3-dioxygenase-like lactoylglutathione lyase family enzyme
MSQEAADLFTRLAPVLNVRDLAAERAFYVSLGLPVIYQGPEYPEFIGFEPRRCISASRKRQPTTTRRACSPGRSASPTSTLPLSGAARRASASNSNATTPVPGGRTGGCSSGRRAATGWHSKAQTNDRAAQRPILHSNFDLAWQRVTDARAPRHLTGNRSRRKDGGIMTQALDDSPGPRSACHRRRAGRRLAQRRC